MLRTFKSDCRTQYTKERMQGSGKAKLHWSSHLYNSIIARNTHHSLCALYVPWVPCWRLLVKWKLFFTHTITETTNFIHTSLPCNLFKEWGLLLGIHQCWAADRYHTSLPWVFFQPNTKLTKAVVKFRWCSPITLGKNLSLINEDAGKSYWNKKQNQTYWVRKHYFENQLKIQDVILIFTVKTNTKEPYHREKKNQKTKTTHTSSSLTTLKYRIFTKKAISQNQLCRQLGNSPPKHKLQPGNHYCTSWTAAITGRFL